MGKKAADFIKLPKHLIGRADFGGFAPLTDFTRLFVNPAQYFTMRNRIDDIDWL